MKTPCVVVTVTQGAFIGALHMSLEPTLELRMGDTETSATSRMGDTEALRHSKDFRASNGGPGGDPGTPGHSKDFRAWNGRHANLSLQQDGLHLLGCCRRLIKNAVNLKNADGNHKGKTMQYFERCTTVSLSSFAFCRVFFSDSRSSAVGFGLG